MASLREGAEAAEIVGPLMPIVHISAHVPGSSGEIAVLATNAHRIHRHAFARKVAGERFDIAGRAIPTGNDDHHGAHTGARKPGAKGELFAVRGGPDGPLFGAQRWPGASAWVRFRELSAGSEKQNAG